MSEPIKIVYSSDFNYHLDKFAKGIDANTVRLHRESPIFALRDPSYRTKTVHCNELPDFG